MRQYLKVTTIIVITVKQIKVIKTMKENILTVTNSMPRTQKRTNIYITDEELWAWAQYRAKTLGYKVTSEYIANLIKIDREKEIAEKAERGLELDRVRSA